MKEVIEILLDRIVSQSTEEFNERISLQSVQIHDLIGQIESLRMSLAENSTLLERANVELVNYRKKKQQSEKPLADFYCAASEVIAARTGEKRKKAIEELRAARNAAAPFIDIIPF